MFNNGCWRESNDRGEFPKGNDENAVSTRFTGGNSSGVDGEHYTGNYGEN